MKPIRIGFHSMVDVITNSSTTIFTYSGGAEKPAKELVNEFLKCMGSELTADEMFDIFVMPNGWAIEIWVERIGEDDSDELNDLPDDLVKAIKDGGIRDINDCIKNVAVQISRSEIVQPSWFSSIFDAECGDWVKCGTDLYIQPKEEKYTELAKRLIDFLYSTNHEAVYNG
jgi:hypothetical protein